METNLKYYSVDEASKITKTCTQTIRRNIKSKKLKASKIGHGYIISENDLKDFIASKQTKWRQRPIIYINGH